ncbi:DUF4190 domain-containing protein [Streptomyces sp. 184]|uniref:DUF4190 domain-containing protein n=1 Tax=Streptomyces sp. 184 TaxID=1827526 RepID=UPI003891FE0D
MDTDRRDDAAGRGALQAEVHEEPDGAADGRAGDRAAVDQDSGAAGGPASGTGDLPEPGDLPETGEARETGETAGTDVAARLTPPDGGPPVPVAPGWLRPEPAPGPYGPKPYLPAPYAWVPPPGLRNGSGTAALILGVIGAVLAFTLLLSPLAVILGGLAIGFGIVTIRRVRRGEARNRASGLWGIWLGGVAAVVGVGMSILLVVLAVDFFAPVSPETESAVEAGETVRFDDGLEVTVEAERIRGDFLEVRVRVENGTGELATLANSDVSAYPIGSDADYLEQESGHGLPFTLAEDHVATGTYRFVLDEGLDEVEFEVSPGGPYEYAYWWTDLDGRSGERAA